MDTKIAFDVSSFLWRALLAGEDAEFGYKAEHNDKIVHVNSANWGYNHCVDMMMGAMKMFGLNPIDAILVFDGMSSKGKRLLISNTYKAKSDNRSPQHYAEFTAARDRLTAAWLNVGAICMTQDYAEADDTFGWLANETEANLIIATYDGDMAVLNRDANKYGASVYALIGDKFRENRCAEKVGLPFPTHLITAYKALVGDTSDNIPGCVKFGDVAFRQFIELYGIDGLQQFQDMCEAGSLDALHAMDAPLLQRIAAQEEGVLKSYQLARLYPEWVNTRQQPLKIQAGIVGPLLPYVVNGVEKPADDRFAPYAAKQWLVTAPDYDKALAFAKKHAKETRDLGFDIETSTPDESTDWQMAKGKPDGVDVFGSYLVGMGLTFGSNNQYTMYFSVKHAETENITSEQACALVDVFKESNFIIQNTSFEASILYQEWHTFMGDNGFKGYLPNMLDTALEASYVDENSKRGLKERTEKILGYKQQTYDEVTLVSGFEQQYDEAGNKVETPAPILPKGGRVVELLNDAGQLPYIKKRYKMHELSAAHVFHYGADDPRCTVALHNYYKLIMQLEHTYKVYLQVEIDAAYLHAQSFVRGMPISLEKMNELAKIDTETWNTAWVTVRKFLIEQGWEGTIPPSYTKDITPAQLKEAYEIRNEKKLDTMVRTMSKLVIFIRETLGDVIFADKLQRLLEGDEAGFNSYVLENFKGEPLFDTQSPKQKAHLLYEVMKLPIRVRNKPTDLMKANGIWEGSPKADVVAVTYALTECTPEQKDVLDALRLMGMVDTRRSLYYDKYPSAIHWKDGLIHSSHNQCETNTRRASESDVNRQQMPKHPKIEGQPARFREVVIPHKPTAVVFSMDFDSQELRVLADTSGDVNMTACFVGDNKRKMHEMTGVGIYNKKFHTEMSYEEFSLAIETGDHEFYKAIKQARADGKKLNFTAEYGAMAPKVAITMMVPEREAQLFIDAREEMFAGATQWKVEVVKGAKTLGYVCSRLGARRHLAEALDSRNRSVSSKAERQAINYEIQGSCAEMTKLAEGRMWRAGIFDKFDAVCYGPIHDEVIGSCDLSDLHEFLPAMHACMVAQYADMKIPMLSSISFGPSFGEQIEIGAEPTKEAIDAGLEKLRKMLEGKAHA